MLYVETATEFSYVISDFYNYCWILLEPWDNVLFASLFFF